MSKAKKVIFVIVEGPTDKDALSSVLKQIFSSAEVHFHVIYGAAIKTAEHRHIDAALPAAIAPVRRQTNAQGCQAGLPQTARPVQVPCRDRFATVWLLLPQLSERFCCTENPALPCK